MAFKLEQIVQKTGPNGKIEFESTFKRRLIYVFTIADPLHEGLVKVGETTFDADSETNGENCDRIDQRLEPNSDFLNEKAMKRIREYTATAGLRNVRLLHTEVAIREKDGDPVSFRDHDVHEVLKNSGFPNVDMGTDAKEWFKIDLNVAKAAITAVKKWEKNLSNTKIGKEITIIFREEQEDAIQKTIGVFKDSDRMLWNAKMRFGKTLTALEVIRRMGFKKTIIITHRPVVDGSWYEDFGKIFHAGSGYIYGSKKKGNSVKELEKKGNRYVYFASIQDLRGAELVGGKFDKNDDIFKPEWDLLIIDEAHEGTVTALGQNVKKALIKKKQNGEKTKLLELSGTPFNIQLEYNDGNTFTWDYGDEQEKKKIWQMYHFGDSNPYADLPEMRMFTYKLDDFIKHDLQEFDNKSFSFKEFFRVAEQNDETDEPVFVHEDDVNKFLNLLCKNDEKFAYPFATEKYRDLFKHTFWLLPGVLEARAFEKLLKKHPVFGCGAFEIVNVAGDGNIEASQSDIDAVKKAIADAGQEGYTITLSCGKLTTGVTIPEWTAIFMLKGSVNTQPAAYLQAIFRVQSPCKRFGKVKTHCYVFDFAPDRTLSMIAEAAHVSSKPGQTDDAGRQRFDRILKNYLSIIAYDGSGMKVFDANSALQRLKKAYVERIVNCGFDDNRLYDKSLLNLSDQEKEDFEDLKGYTGTRKSNDSDDVVINDEGFDTEEYDNPDNGNGGGDPPPPKPPKPPKTDEEKEAERRKKERKKAISILSTISIRMPMLIYGADVPFDEDISIEHFIDLVDDLSWKEFMPEGVDKEHFKKFIKYYDKDVFVACGREIRQQAKKADDCIPEERIWQIIKLLGKFKNPDKETVLTPWRVVNLHMGRTLGGYNFFEDDTQTLCYPHLIESGEITKETVCNKNAKILEINSKSGLYPLYVAYSIYREKISNYPGTEEDQEWRDMLWKETIEKNIFVICKTPMAKSITRRTLCGYKEFRLQGDNRAIKPHCEYYEDLVNVLHEDKLFAEFKNNVLSPAYWGIEDEEMKTIEFKAVVGNPPYQGNNHQQIYPFFYLAATELSSRFVSLIFPTGWQEAKNGNNLGKLNNETVKRDHQIHFIDNWQNVFPGISGAEFVNIILWEKGFDNELEGSQRILTNGGDEHEVLLPIKKDAAPKPSEILTLVKIVKGTPGFQSLQQNTSVRKPYGLSTDVFKAPEKYGLEPFQSKRIKATDLKIYSAKDVIMYAPRDYKLPKKTKAFDKYKVFVTYAWGNMDEKAGLGGAFSNVFIGAPYEISTESFLESGCFEDKETAKKHAKYLMTKFARACLYANKYSQHSTTAWGAVPVQDYTEPWWEEDDLHKIDLELYKKYAIPEDVSSFIEKKIQTKTIENIVNFN